MPVSTLRIPLRAVILNGLVEAENLVLDSVIAFKVEDMSVYAPEWRGNNQVRFDSRNFKLVLSDLPERVYTLDIYYFQGPDYGNADIYYHQKKVGKIEGFKPDILPTRKVSLKKVKPVNNRIELEYVVMSKDPRSSGMAIGIDGFKLEPVREYIPEWIMIGPFPNPRASDSLRYGLDTVYPPENEIDLKRAYSGVDGQQVSWQKIRTPRNGYITLYDKVQPYELVVTYALTYIQSPVEQEVSLLIGSDDGCKVFLNDQEIFKFPGVRVAEPDQDEMSLFLHKGTNKLLLKIENNFGGYAFYARLRDIIGNLMTVALPAP